MTTGEAIAALEELAKTAMDASRAIASSGIDFNADFALAGDAYTILENGPAILAAIDFQGGGVGANLGPGDGGKIGAGR